MAVRLSVVMVHCTPATQAAEQVAQGVVGELIGLSGIDLILVAPLDSLSEASTDRLTLSSLGGDIAVLDWRLPEVMHESLRRLGVDGARTRHAADPAASEKKGAEVNSKVQPRKLYFFNLNDFTDPDVVVSSIAELNAARAVRTFTLAPIVKRPVTGSPGQSENPRVVSKADNGTESEASLATDAPPNAPSSDVATSLKSAGSPLTQGASESLPQRSPAVSSDAASSEQDLDALIDELDLLDP